MNANNTHAARSQLKEPPPQPSPPSAMMDLMQMHIEHMRQGSRIFANKVICVSVRCDAPVQEQITEIDSITRQLAALRGALADMPATAQSAGIVLSEDC